MITMIGSGKNKTVGFVAGHLWTQQWTPLLAGRWGFKIITETMAFSFAIRPSYGGQLPLDLLHSICNPFTARSVANLCPRAGQLLRPNDVSHHYEAVA
jgi:hypothetical protein